MSVAAQQAPAAYTSIGAGVTSATSIIPASGNASESRDLVSLIITTPNAAAATLTLSDGTKTVGIFNYPNAALAPGTPFVLNFCDVPLEQSSPNAAWTITASANVSGYNVTAQYVQRP